MTKEQDKAIRNMENFAYGKDMACVSASDIKTAIELIQEQQAELEKKNKVIDKMAETIMLDRGKMGFFWCNDCPEIIKCKYNNNIIACIKQYYERCSREMIKNNKEELIKLIQDNPKLPLVFMMSNDEVAGDYGCTVMEEFTAYKSEIYKYERWGDLVFSDDESEVEEYYTNELAEEEKYKDLPQEEYEKEIKKYVKENVEHYEAIVIYAG